MAHQSPLNGGSAHMFRRFCTAGKRCFALWLALCWCAAPMASAQASGAASAITVITLERNCFGCTTGSLLVLRSDGTASYTVTGNARHGTQDKSARGSIRKQDFDALARFAASQGFFAMADSYEDPEVQDGAWTTTSIARGEQDKRVFRRNDTGPAELKAIEAAIETLRTKLSLVPDGR